MNYKSLTMDDIFTDYNNIHNHLNISCNYQGSNAINKTSFIYIYTSGESVLRRKIMKDITENLKIKHYIKIGEECPICYDKILHRKHAFLTDCGHAFHYKCIIDYDYINTFTKNGIYCPLCREDMGYYDDMKDRYKDSSDKFDKLEDFETNIKLKFPKICYDIYELGSNNNKHFHRMNYFNCIHCQI